MFKVKTCDVELQIRYEDWDVLGLGVWMHTGAVTLFADERPRCPVKLYWDNGKEIRDYYIAYCGQLEQVCTSMTPFSLMSSDQSPKSSWDLLLRGFKCSWKRHHRKPQQVDSTD